MALQVNPFASLGIDFDCGETAVNDDQLPVGRMISNLLLITRAL